MEGYRKRPYQTNGDRWVTIYGYLGNWTGPLKDVRQEDLVAMICGDLRWNWKTGDASFGKTKFEDGWVYEPIEEEKTKAVGTQADSAP
jgi:hypothetical protein